MERYIILLLTILAFSSCDSLFDEELPPHNMVGESIITNETTAEVALNGVYSFLGQEGALTSYMIVDNEWRLGILKGSYRGNFDEDQLGQFKYTVEHNDVREPWEITYKMINAANNFIYYTGKLSDSQFGPGRKDEMLAEARFMRAWGYMFLLRRYGYFWDVESPYGVVLRLEPSSLSNNSQGRATVKESYEAIFEDLDFVIEKGPAHYSKYRACSTLAKAYKSFLLLDRGGEGDAAEALRLADEVLASKEFELENSYEDIFKKKYSSSELMFTRHLKEVPSLEDNMPSILKLFGDGIYTLNEVYVHHFPKTDVRYAVALDSIIPKVEGDKVPRKKQIWKKHFSADDNSPMYYMRIAQLYFIKAEAMLRTGAPFDEIVAVLSALEVKRGNPSLVAADYSTSEQVQNLIFDLALREFGTENGDLFFMAVRMREGGRRLIADFNEAYVDEKQLCFPIPINELEHNFVVKQNPL